LIGEIRWTKRKKQLLQREQAQGLVVLVRLVLLQPLAFLA